MINSTLLKKYGIDVSKFLYSYTYEKTACRKDDVKKLKLSKRYFNKDIVNYLIIEAVYWNSYKCLEYLANKKNANLDFCIEYYKILNNEIIYDDIKQDGLRCIEMLTIFNEKIMLTKIAKPKKLSKPRPLKP